MPQIHVLEQLRGPLARLPPAQAGAEGAELDVLENGEAGKRGDVLEGADDAAGHEPLRLPAGRVDAVEDHPSPRERDKARDGVHERRLARAVRADQAHDLTALEGQVDAVDGPDAFEVDADPLRDELPGARAVDSVLHRFLLVP